MDLLNLISALYLTKVGPDQVVPSVSKFKWGFKNVKNRHKIGKFLLLLVIQVVWVSDSQEKWKKVKPKFKDKSISQ